MRFILAMVRILGILLSIALFCIFIYFAFIDKSNTNNSKFLSYGSLLLFVFSTIITSLISVGFENYQNKRQSSDVLSDINNRLKLFNNWQSASPAPVPEVNVQAIIDKLSADSAKTAQLLDSGVEKINRQIYQLRDSDTAKTINFGLENINNRLTEIQESSIASAKSAITPLTDLTKLYDDFSALINDSNASYRNARATASTLFFSVLAIFVIFPDSILKTVHGSPRFLHKSATNDASPPLSFFERIPWSTLITRSKSDGKISASERSSDTESAPPETATPSGLFSAMHCSYRFFPSLLQVQLSGAETFCCSLTVRNALTLIGQRTGCSSCCGDIS